jgi:exodeoxyribonuclease VII small subunit
VTDARKKPADAQLSPQDLSFEEALSRVEQIIERIESGEIGLEQSLTEYENGVELVRRCRAILDRAQQKVDDLSQRMRTESTDQR